MFSNKEFIGLAIQDDVIRVARVRVKGKTIQLVKLDRVTLADKIKPVLQKQEVFEGEPVESFESNGSDNGNGIGSIFGLESNEPKEEEEIDFKDLESGGIEEEDEFSLDMVGESETAESNEIVLYEILNSIDRDQVNLGLNVPAGSTIFQIIKDKDFSKVKQKELVRDVEDKLETIYGSSTSPSNYSYEIREDGSLLLGSLDNESVSLELINKTRDFYSGKLMIESVVPDEIALVGLVRTNYKLESDEITGVIQFGKETCRMFFMKGEEIWLISPVINEGTNSKTFLDTIFSKILFQLDSAEVPYLDKIILADNTIGNSAVHFFENNFPDIEIENISFKADLVDSQSIDPSSLPPFTTAIGAAVSASGVGNASFPKLEFLPKYVEDRQKVFKLQWHGIAILLLIFLAPITINHFYSQNAWHIESMTDDLEQMNTQITEITPTVNKANELNENMEILKGKLTMLDTLSRGSREWSAKLGILNNGIQDVRSSWITSLSESKEGTFLQGYTFYRNRVPQIVNVFEEATLLSVNIEEIRENEVFIFSILVKDFTPSDSLYSPPTPVEVKKLIQS